MRVPSRGTITAGLLIASLILLPPTGAQQRNVQQKAAQPKAQSKGSAAEQVLLASANRDRAAHGLPPLKWDATLARAARHHALRMAQQNGLSHQFPGEPDLPARAAAAGSRFSSLAENVAEGPTPAYIHAQWMKSPHHRANLLDADLDSVGIAVSRRNGLLFAVEDFSRAVPPDPPRRAQNRKPKTCSLMPDALGPSQCLRAPLCLCASVSPCLCVSLLSFRLAPRPQSR